MDQIFTTDDISISSYLLVKGALIREVTSDRPAHFVFVFDNYDLCSELKREYLNNGIAPARELFNRREELINEMRDRNRNGGINGGYR